MQMLKQFFSFQFIQGENETSDRYKHVFVRDTVNVNKKHMLQHSSTNISHSHACDASKIGSKKGTDSVYVIFMNDES